MHALPRSPRAPVLAAVAGLVLLSMAAATRVGVVALALPAVAGGALALLRRPDVAVGAFVGLHLLAEADRDSWMSTAPLHANRVASLSIIELVGFLAIAAVALDCTRRRRLPPVPPALAAGLGLVAAGLATGLATGWYGGGVLTQMYSSGRSLIFLIAMPLLVAAVVRTREQALWAVAAVGAVAVLKAALGVGAVIAGEELTYYEAAPNLLILLFILAVLAGGLRLARLPAWSLWLWPLAVAAVVLSYRRGFWIAAVLGMLIVVVFGLSRVQRRLALPTLALIGGAVWLLLSGGVQIELEGRLIRRAEALTPEKVLANRQDTYRLDERVNVLEELRRQPVTGLGLGVPWTARHALPLEHEGGRQYSHVAVLWWWLKLGILGPLAYLTLYGFGVAAAFRTANSHPDRRLAAVGLGAAGALLGLLAAEATATQFGANPRFTVLFGGLLGLLAVLRSQALEHERAQRAQRHHRLA